MEKFTLSQRLSATATLGVISMTGTQAFAGNTSFVTLTSNIKTATSGFPMLISLLGYIAGCGMAVAGIFKLKQHVDSPGNVPMKDGMMRLASGGALLSLPFMTQAMQGSISNGVSNNVTIQKLAEFQ